MQAEHLLQALQGGVPFLLQLCLRLPATAHQLRIKGVRDHVLSRRMGQQRGYRSDRAFVFLDV